MRLIFLMITAFMFLIAGNIIELKKYKSSSFSPVQGENFNICFKLNESAEVILDIYTPDKNLIRNYNKKFQKGDHCILWDGKDKWGEVVPDEAYEIEITAKSHNKTENLIFSQTGGEVLKSLNAKYDRMGNIYYTLSKPARVLIRAGILNGPMLTVISNWEPKDKGYVKQQWNLKDKDGVVNFSAIPFVVSVSAYSLPEYSIITYGNNKEKYLDYFLRHKFKCNKKVPEKLPENKNISFHYYKCRIDEREPVIYINMPKTVSIGKRVNIKIDMDKKDEEEFNKIKYEISFFVDYKFVSEEELGYLPFTWSYLPNNLSEGPHVLTVNVTAFNGKVGVKNVKFVVKNSKDEK